MESQAAKFGRDGRVQGVGFIEKEKCKSQPTFKKRLGVVPNLSYFQLKRAKILQSPSLF